MGKKLTVAIVGAGNVGSALAVSLHNSTYKVLEIASRKSATALRNTRKVAARVGAEVIALGDRELCAHLVWLCVSDSAVAEVARHLASASNWKGRVVFHSSGALSSDELGPLRDAGASVASVHPMMSFVRGKPPELAGVTFAIEGDALAVRSARQIVRDLKAREITIRKQDKSLYHAWGAFASPLVIAELAAAEQVAAAIGISSRDARKTLAPMLRRTIENYVTHGAAAAFSGPIVRGDVDTVRMHLKALKKVPRARQVYLTLAREAIRELPAANRRELLRLVSAED
jgi:predicted short-subunit dehydrogenase-like oxidoreductase (DUF2520 family)